MKRIIQSIVIVGLLLCSSMAFAQYEEEPYIEGSIGANMTVPLGYMKNDLIPDSLNAKAGIGFDVSGGYYLSTQVVLGLYFNLRTMAAEELDLIHSVYEFGAYGKYFLRDLTKTSFSPYIKLSAGVNFSKLVTLVEDNGLPVFRELSYNPTLGAGATVGLHYRTNGFGALFLEGTYQYDMMDGVVGAFKGVDYKWGDNNQYFIAKAGVMFNIGPKQ